VVEVEQLKREVTDTLQQLVMLAHCHLPLRCRFCHEPIDLVDCEIAVINKGTVEDGVYHSWCHEQAFPSEYGLK